MFASVFVWAIAKGFARVDPAEKLSAVLKPLRKGRQPAITDLPRLRATIIAAEVVLLHRHVVASNWAAKRRLAVYKNGGPASLGRRDWLSAVQV